MAANNGRPATAGAHLLMVPYPAQPHILPMLDLARQIASRGDVAITFLCHQTLIDHLRGEEGSTSENGGINFVGVGDDEPEYPANFPSTGRNSMRLAFNMEPFVEQVLRDRESHGVRGPTCMLVDYIHYWSVDPAVKLGIPRYVLVVSVATRMAAQLSFHEHGVEDLPGGGIRLAGIPPKIITERWEFPIDMPVLKEMIARWMKSAKASDGVLLNAWTALESQTIDCIRIMLPKNLPVLPVGPLGVLPSTNAKNISIEGLALSDDDETTNWLDQQPRLSVLYVSFGTTGMRSLSKRHVLALAEGLDRSGERFVWALRAPPDVADMDDALPPGFEGRTRGRGLLLRGWAPQKLILAHPSTGAFLSSCGWNSAAESLSRGVPVIGWPSFADQPTVCRILALSKVALELPHQEGYFVSAEVIANAINIMLRSEEGAAMRQRAEQCKAAIVAALAPGGSSFRSVDDFFKLIQKRGRLTKAK